MVYKEECLQALLSFFLEDSDRPLERTEIILNWRMTNFYEEVNENLAERSGLSARMYVDYVLDELCSPGFYAYATLARMAPESGPVPFIGVDAAQQLERFVVCGDKLKQFYNKKDSPGLKKIKLEKTLKNIEYWQEQLNLAGSFAEDCYRNGKKTFLQEREPDGLSERLERDREEVFLDSINQPIKYHSVPQEINKARMLLRLIRLATLNLKSEIDQNFFTLVSGITGPYLQLLLRKFRRQLELAHEMPAPYCRFSPEVHQNQFCGKHSWTELQELLQRVHTLRLGSLEEICGLLEERLEMQQLLLEHLEKNKRTFETVNKNFLLMEDSPLYQPPFNAKKTSEDHHSLGIPSDISTLQLQQILDQVSASVLWAAENREAHPETGKKWSSNFYGPHFSFFNAHTCDRLILASYNQPPVLPE